MQNKFDNTKLADNIKKIKHILVVLSGKGGVGKSTVSANLAFALSEKGYKVGILDSDFHGPSIPKMLGVEDKKPSSTVEGFNPVFVNDNLKVMSIGFLTSEKDDPVIWRGPMKMGAVKQFLTDVNWGDLDYMIIDLPPGTGDESLSIIQMIPDNDGAIIVTTPQDVALSSVRKSINFVKKMNMPIVGIVENMSGFTCPHCNKNIDVFKTGGGKKASEDFDIVFLGGVPLDPDIVSSGDEGRPFVFDETKSVTTEAFRDIVLKIEGELEKNGGK